MRAAATSLSLLAVALAACSGGGRAPAYVAPPVDMFAPVAVADLGKIDSALRRFSADHAGRLPTSLDGLVTERAPDGDPYLTRVPTDPWGRSYDYAVLSSRYGAYDLRSHGPDRLPATRDDVVRSSGSGETR